MGARKKCDVINSIISRFGFKRYFEYNKFDGENLFNEVECDQKVIAYIPELVLLDAFAAERFLDQAKSLSIAHLLHPAELLGKYGVGSFDVVFFDPVHYRPAVDETLKLLAQLVRPGGFLVMHDCNPTERAWTAPDRVPGPWCGESYKSFAIFRFFNPSNALTIDEDFGVGVIWNRDLQLDFPVDLDFNYDTFDGKRKEFNGLTRFEDFDTSSPAELAAVFERQAAHRIDKAHLRPVHVASKNKREDSDEHLAYRSEIARALTEAKTALERVAIADELVELRDRQLAECQAVVRARDKQIVAANALVEIRDTQIADLRAKLFSR